MQQKSIPNYLLISSLFTTQELKINDNKELEVNKLSVNKASVNNIPLDLIETEPKITTKPSYQLLLLSILVGLSSIAFYFTTVKSTVFPVYIISGVFLLLAITTAVLAFKKRVTTYTFFYENSKTHLLTLHDSGTDTPLIENFIIQLKNAIGNAKETYSVSINEGEFTHHLDYLYNHDMVTDIAYQRIKNRINNKVLGVEEEVKLADVIYLSMKNA